MGRKWDYISQGIKNYNKMIVIGILGIVWLGLDLAFGVPSPFEANSSWG